MKKKRMITSLPFIIAFICVLLISFVGVRFYDYSVSARNSSPLVGTYALGEQVSDDCIYVCVGNENLDGDYICIIYKQDSDFAKATVAEVDRKELTAFSGKDLLTLKKGFVSYTITYQGDSYQTKKIADEPSFTSNEKASKLYDKYYKAVTGTNAVY